MITPRPSDNVYDRLFDESEIPWSAFQRYRDLPNPRPTLEVFSIDTIYTVPRLKDWYRKHDWAARLCAWDQRVDAVRQNTTLRGVEEMTARHLELARLALEAVRKSLTKISRDLDNQTFNIRPNEVARLAEVFIKHERLARGEATERVEDTNGIDYSKLSDEDLAALEKISKKMR